MKKIFSTLCVLLGLAAGAQAQQASSDLMITEFQWRSISGTDNLEFVEIMNTTNAPLNIKGVKVQYNTTLKYTFPDTTLAPYAIILLAHYPDRLRTEYGIDSNQTIIDLGTSGLSNSGATIYLRTENNVVLDSVKYSTSLGNITGRTIEFCDLTADNKISTTGWAESTTPVLKDDGTQNSVGGKLMFGTPGFLAVGCEWPRAAVVDPCLGVTIAATAEGCGENAEVLNATGGVAPYTYAWSNGASTAAATNLVAGETYTVTVADANGCETILTYEAVACPVVDPCIGVTIEATAEGCGENAEVLNAVGGVAPYTYTWSNGEATAAATNLVAGETYTVTVADANGCETILTYEAVACPVVDPCIGVTIEATAEGCSENAEVLNAAGGVAPYTYTWSNGEATAAVTNLVAGETYTVTVADANGCETILTYEAVACPVVDPCIGVTIEATAEGCGENAEVLNAAGGVAPYTYTWSNGEATAVVTNLVAGETYTVTVADANGCETILTYEAVACPVVDPCLNVTISYELDACDTSAEVKNVTGGTAPYTYAWSTGETTEQITGLVLSETYTVTITDANGCEVIETFVQQVCPAVNQVAAGFEMNVYPNPANHTAVLALATAQMVDLRIELVNVMGQVIYSQEIAQNGEMIHNLPVADFTAGVYFVKVSSKEGVATMRLIIAK